MRLPTLIADNLRTLSFCARSLVSVTSELQRSFALGSDGYPRSVLAIRSPAVPCLQRESLPEGSLSHDVSQSEFDSKGRVDFYVNSAYHWGVIELTREHDRLQATFRPLPAQERNLPTPSVPILRSLRLIKYTRWNLLQHSRTGRYSSLVVLDARRASHEIDSGDRVPHRL